MNGRRANKLRRMARDVVNESVPSSTTGVAQARLAEKLYREIKVHWQRLSHRERGRFSVRDVAKGLRRMR